jgi:outer membrane murein-binding lipoprotein Lpp
LDCHARCLSSYLSTQVRNLQGSVDQLSVSVVSVGQQVSAVGQEQHETRTEPES